MSKLLWIASVSGVCASCTPGDGQLLDRRRSPELSGVPVWTAIGPAPDTGRCFGTAVAAGDLDGDGRREVIVGESPCIFTPVTGGRIAIYRGGDPLPSTMATFTELDWLNPPRGGTQLTLSVGDVDGDRRDDLLVRSAAGVQVFAGIADVGAPLGAPRFRVPGTGLFGPAVLADLDGDRRADIISVKAGAATVWLATPGAAGGPFTAARVIAPVSVVIAAGDTNGDRRDDVIVIRPTGASQLLRGCRAGQLGCDGGLRAAPEWAIEQPAIGMVPDINHDGLAEAIVADAGFGGVGFGRAWLHLSDPATEGLSPVPSWATIGDPNHFGLGRPVVVPGDLDGDHRSNEFVLSSGGRAYAFFPRASELAALAPGFAWPREDSVQAQREAGELQLGPGARGFAAAGDVDRDRFDDLVVGDPPDFGNARPGAVHLLAGGRLPRGNAPPPFLPGAPVCNLPATLKPDLTVDAAALARSLFVDTIDFPPGACEIFEGCIGGPGPRRLLRFSTAIANYGGAPATIPGPDIAPELYHLDECHGHHHLTDFAQYELIDAGGTTIAAGRKQGFFLVDVAPNCIDGPPAGDYFPDQGISPGWADVYDALIPCQWLDATEVPDGRYTLRIGVDTRKLIAQDDVLPDTVAIELILDGDSVTVLR